MPKDFLAGFGTRTGVAALSGWASFENRCIRSEHSIAAKKNRDCICYFPDEAKGSDYMR